MNLESYGIFMTLRKGMHFEKELELATLKHGSFSRSQGRFELPSGTYTLGPLLGKGSYGETYQAIHTTKNKVYAIKVLSISRTYPHQFIVNSIKESIINILLEEESRGESEGPYVPRLYEMALDPVRNLLLIRQERLYGTMSHIYNSSTSLENDINVPESLGQLAYILDFFYKKLEFNHRDLKSDNVMYTIAKNQSYQMKLIDFGFSCLTWKGVKIAGTHYFPIESKCFVPSRDLTQYIHEILYSYDDRFSKDIRDLLQDLLTFPTGTRMCRLFEGCKHRHTEVKGWRGIYDFLNLPDVKNPQATPSALYRRMAEYLGRGSPKTITPVTPVPRSKTENLKLCLPEQILNPKTRRCVRRSGALGRKLLMQSEARSPSPTLYPTRKVRPCAAGKTRNPKTQRCRFRCPSSMIRNPRTQKCVSRFGPVGRRLLREGAKTTPQREEVDE